MIKDKIKEILQKRGISTNTLEGIELVSDLVEFVYDQRSDTQTEMIKQAKKRYEV